MNVVFRESMPYDFGIRNIGVLVCIINTYNVPGTFDVIFIVVRHKAKIKGLFVQVKAIFGHKKSYGCP